MHDFDTALFGRMLQLRLQVLDEDLAVLDPDEHAEIWARYMELRDLANRLGLLDEFTKFVHYEEELHNV